MNAFDNVYLIGIGGIGMSNLARYFMMKGKKVAGYDRTKTDLTLELEKEGAEVCYSDEINNIPSPYRNESNTLVVYTPAIPKDSEILNYFLNQGFNLQKRAQVLGIITEHSKAICCAGTHGKTTTSSMVAHIFHLSSFGCNAFLGGILKNYNTNILLDEKSPYTIIEADEYDRSFHWLHPYMSLITSVSPDHLDIYNTEKEYKESFAHFASLTRSDGALVVNHSANLDIPKQIKTYTYSIDRGDFYAKNIKIGNGEIRFDFVTPTNVIENIELGVPIKINIENAVGAMALAYLNGISPEILRLSMKTFLGAKRRFDFHLKSNNFVYVDDYAHHPEEIEASVSSIKELYKDKKITGIFQPHLYTRTRDFADEFATSLSLLDELILLDIYPAREKPIEGVTSEMLFNKITCKKTLCKKENLLELLKKEKGNIEILVTLGAGDIDQYIEPISQLFKDRV